MSPRFLLVRFSAIGDCVMAAWAATAYREKYPEGFLCWAVESRCASIIERSRLCNLVHEFPREQWKKKRWSPAVWREQILAYTELRKLHFDAGLDLQGHSKTALCLRIANPRRRIQARATDAMARRLNPMPTGQPEGMHAIEWNHHALEQLGEFELPERPIMPAAHARSPGLVTISVSAGQTDKTYPADGWKQVAGGLLSKGLEVRFLGGPGDPQIRCAGAIDLVGKLSLSDSMNEVARSGLHLCADTGTGHMAAAYGTPVISVFGPTDPHVYRPYGCDGVVLRNGKETSAVTPEEILETARCMLQ
jgi:ADP-heptose:LPS heptosyltransferase